MIVGFPEFLPIWRNISLSLSLVSISVAYLVHCFPFCLAGLMILLPLRSLFAVSFISPLVLPFGKLFGDAISR